MMAIKKISMKNWDNTWLRKLREQLAPPPKPPTPPAEAPAGTEAPPDGR